MKRTAGLILQGVIVAYIVIFSVINMQKVAIKFFVSTPSYDIPLFMLVLFTLFIGFIFGVILVSLEKFVINSKMKKLMKQIKEYQDEIERLKNIAVTGANHTDNQNNPVSENESEVHTDIKNILR